LGRALFRSKTFHVVEHERVRALLEIYWRPPREACPPVKNHWARLWSWCGFRDGRVSETKNNALSTESVQDRAEVVMIAGW